MTNEAMNFECGCQLVRCHCCPTEHWRVETACPVMTALMIAHINLIGDGKLDVDEAGANVAPHLITQICHSIKEITEADQDELLKITAAVRDQVGFEYLMLVRENAVRSVVEDATKEALTRMHLQD